MEDFLTEEEYLKQSNFNPSLYEPFLPYSIGRRVIINCCGWDEAEGTITSRLVIPNVVQITTDEGQILYTSVNYLELKD